MAEVTYYVALPFVATDYGIAPGLPVECASASAAVMRAEVLSRKQGHIGALAFSRSGDPSTGEFTVRDGDQEVRRRAGRSERIVTASGQSARMTLVRASRDRCF